MTRLAQEFPVLFFEEPIFDQATEPYLELEAKEEFLTVARVHLPVGCSEAEIVRLQRQFLSAFISGRGLDPLIAWYYTPMALAFSNDLRAQIVVYDCMDELSAFKGAHPHLHKRERELLSRADLVFTGGFSLYHAKRSQHADVHAFPSSVDFEHFSQARESLDEPEDQRMISGPKIGFFGVLDERLDKTLVAHIADARPDWQIVMIGPVVKIDPQELPRRANIHYLGRKSYDELPHYLGGWDVALMPFALNESTRFISPTKTPEYLAGGRPVVSTMIEDVVRQYGDLSGVELAADHEEFVEATGRALDLARHPEQWRPAADILLADNSWNSTWSRMSGLIREKLRSLLEHRVIPIRPVAPHIGRRPGFDYLIVGAGFAGSVLAERLATDAGKSVLLLDRRNHIGGNAYDHYDDAGVLVHRYGPHIFHTNSDRVADYLSRFTKWRPYEHRVRAQVDGRLLPVPINLTTINAFFGLSLKPDQAEAFLASKAVPVASVTNSEEVVLSRVGPELYEALFRGYTRKQWGVEPAELDKAVAGRLPVRHDTDDRYFTDRFQQMPLHGYTRMFENMLDHPKIAVMLKADYRDVRREVDFRHLIYTGPIDEFFDYRYGPLPYRSLKFEHRTLMQPLFQPVAVVNYPAADAPYTRITEYKHLTGQSHSATSITYEYPSAEGDPYYPIPRPENAVLYKRYEALADATPGSSFVGRLGTYRYYNMDQVVAQALALYGRLRTAKGQNAVNPQPRRRDASEPLLELDA
jgi:UDP-galactopyranose mutase